MSEEQRNYEKLIRKLKDSGPIMNRSSEIEDEVMNRIRNYEARTETKKAKIESFFGWIYIGWVRYSLAGVAVCIFAVFLYQQSVILKDLRQLEKEVITINKRSEVDDISDLERKLTVLRVSSKFGSEKTIEIDENRFEEMLEDYNDLQLKYRNLNRIIEDDSVLKALIEKKLFEESGRKSKI